MFFQKVCWALTFCIYVAVAKNIPGTKSLMAKSAPIHITGKTPEETSFGPEAKNSRTLSGHRSARSTEKLNIRTRREVRSLVEAVKANAEKLENLTHGMALLVNSKNREKTDYSDIIKRLENMNPFFVSTFVMLTDVLLSSSPRIAKQHDEVFNMSRYFRENLITNNDLRIFDDKMLTVFKWYGSFDRLNMTSCLELLNAGFRKSGIYPIRVPNSDEVLNVFCDQDTDGGGWLVIQRRRDGSEDFYRSWFDYQHGFGNLTREFWLGNDNIHHFTTMPQELRVELMDFNGNTVYAKYTSFAVGSSSSNYALSIAGYSGTAGDSMSGDNGARFSTKDSGSSCAQSYKGPWWHKTCYYSNLNGLYFDHGKSSTESLSWWHWRNEYIALKESEMKIRPKT